jgi:hypothetical protein
VNDYNISINGNFILKLLMMCSVFDENFGRYAFKYNPGLGSIMVK